jgi:hypothetical protein
LSFKEIDILFFCAFVIYQLTNIRLEIVSSQLEKASAKRIFDFPGWMSANIRLEIVFSQLEKAFALRIFGFSKRISADIRLEIVFSQLEKHSTQ